MLQSPYNIYGDYTGKYLFSHKQQFSQEKIYFHNCCHCQSEFPRALNKYNHWRVKQTKARQGKSLIVSNTVQLELFETY